MTLEALVNALGNCEVDGALAYAERLLMLGDRAMFGAVNVDDLAMGFRMDSPKLHKALSLVIVKALKDVDFDTVLGKYGRLLREHARSPAVCGLLLMLAEECPDPSRVVQSDLFPFMVLPLASTDESSRQLIGQVDRTLKALIDKDRSLIDLVDKTLFILAPSSACLSDLVPSRLVVTRFSLAVRARDHRLVKSLSGMVFGEQLDLLTAANAIEALAEVDYDADAVAFLDTAAVTGAMLELLRNESLIESVLLVIVKMALSDGRFAERHSLVSLFDSMSGCLNEHPLLLSLAACLVLSESPDQCKKRLVGVLKSAAMFETDVRQINALNGLSIIFDSRDSPNEHVLVMEAFPELFDFIALQIPLKGDQASRSALYKLLISASESERMVKVALDSQKLMDFLLTRSTDRSRHGLQSKHHVLCKLEQSAHCPEPLRIRIQSCLGSGMIGPEERREPSVSVAESYLQ